LARSGSALVVARRPGESFDPHVDECGFYAAAAVSRVASSARLSSGRRFGDAHKLLYRILVSYAGRDGRCFPGLARLAGDLGRKVRSVKMLVDDLEEFGLVALRRRGDGQFAEFSFLWHPIFDSVQRCKVQRSEVQASSVQRCKVQRPYKEEKKLEVYTAERPAGFPPHLAWSDLAQWQQRRVMDALRDARARIEAARNPVRLSARVTADALAAMGLLEPPAGGPVPAAVPDAPAKRDRRIRRSVPAAGVLQPGLFDAVVDAG